MKRFENTPRQWAGVLLILISAALIAFGTCWTVWQWHASIVLHPVPHPSQEQLLEQTIREIEQDLQEELRHLRRTQAGLQDEALVELVREIDAGPLPGNLANDFISLLMGLSFLLMGISLMLVGFNECFV